MRVAFEVNFSCSERIALDAIASGMWLSGH
jgi:hypothetical protein